VPARSSALYRLAWIFYLALAVAGALWIGLERGPNAARLFVVPRQLALDVAAGLAAALVLGGGWWLARRGTSLAGELERRLASVLVGVGAPELVALALLSGFAEELFFRGAVQGAWGPVAATLLFALLHNGRGREFRLWSLFALLAGATFAALTVWRGTLLPAMLAHVVVNHFGLRRLARLAAPGGEERAAP
jgi:membrane protease YdiL (CAAX protease family)